MGYYLSYFGEVNIDKPLDEELRLKIIHYLADEGGEDYPYFLTLEGAYTIGAPENEVKDYDDMVRKQLVALCKCFDEKGYVADGVINWEGEDHEDMGYFLVENNQVTEFHGIVTYKEHKTWYESK